MAPGPKRERAAQVIFRITDLLKSSVSAVLFVLMVALILILGANIILRYFFDAPLAWSNNLSRYAYIFIVLAGAGVAYIDDGHARIDVIYDRVGRKTRKVFDLCHCLIMLSVCVAFIVFGLKHALSMWSVHAPIIPWFPVGAVYLCIPLFAVLVFLYLIRKLLLLL